jgi:hypothetical protein
MSKRSSRDSPVSHWATEPGDKSTRKTVRTQEDKAARLVASSGGARRRPGSGASEFGKGDAVSFRELGECKQTKNKSISIKQAWLAKIEHEAREEGKTPFLHIEFMFPLRAAAGLPTRDATRAWVMVPEWAFAELVEAANRGGRDE